MGDSWGGEPPMVVGAMATLDEEAACLNQFLIFGKILKKLEAFGFWKLKRFWVLDAGLNEEEQSKQVIVEKTQGLFIGLPTTEIRGADLELKLSWRMTLRSPVFQTTFASRMILRDLPVSNDIRVHKLQVWPSRLKHHSQGHVLKHQVSVAS